MAEIKKRNGKWFARIAWRDNDKRRSKSKSGFPTKLLAKQWAVEQESKLNDGVAINKDTSLVDYYRQWVKTYKENKISDVTMNRYNNVENVITDYFHSESIKAITRQQYQQFINEYGANHAPQSVKKLNAIIRACVKSAILDDYLVKDFTQRIELTSNRNKIVKVDYLSLNEIKKLLHYCENELSPRYTSRYMIITAIYTGMRLSEIQALTWQDIDFINATISITKSWNAITKDFKPTKTASSKRTIAVNRELLTLLKQLQINGSTMIFMNQFGTIPTSNAVNKTLRQALAKLNIHRQNFHFHSLRHSHVALLLADGVDIYAISKRLGHSDISTTTNIYAYLIDEYQSKTDKHIIKTLSQL